MPNAKNSHPPPAVASSWWHHGGIMASSWWHLWQLGIKTSPFCQTTVAGQRNGWLSAAKKDLFLSLVLISWLFTAATQTLSLVSSFCSEDHDVLVPPSDYPVKATSHNKPTTSHKAAGHAHTFTIEVARDTALCSGIAFILFCQMFIDCPFQASDFDFCSSDMG